MKDHIHDITSQDYPELIKIWEQSVRATHDFLPKEVINQLKPLILEKYFDAVLLKCCKNEEGHITGFIGISNEKIEMLFISPNVQGQGLGSLLCQYAFKQHGVMHVDVNEQNPKARIFYEKLGFKVVSRSAQDKQGRPYPILHMERR